MKRLRETANFIQCTLRDFAHLKQFRADWRVLRRHSSRSTKHRANRSQDLAEFIVQFTRDVAKCGFLSRDQSLSEFASLNRKRLQTIE